MSHLTYNCDVCRTRIPPLNPRVHCLDPACPDFDLCANCALGERSTPPHVPAHKTKVFKTAGGGGVTMAEGRWYIHTNVANAPPPTQNIATPSLPPRPMAYGPPPLPSRGSNMGTNPNPNPNSNSPTSSHGHSQDSYPSAGWQPFFNPDSSPSHTFFTLINDIFTYLDPTNNGNLVPETFSRFLDDMGYLPHENAWKGGLKATFGLSAESNADKSLKNAFDLFSIDHILLQRQQPPHVDPTGLTSQFSRVLGSAFKPSMLGSSASTTVGPMPAITRAGFVEITRIEALSDPSREWGNFSRLIKKYDLPRYRGWGDLPRSVLPDVPDAAMLQRVAGVNAFAKRQGKEALDAAIVEAQIRARGREAAIDLLSDTRRVEYRYL